MSSNHLWQHAAMFYVDLKNAFRNRTEAGHEAFEMLPRLVIAVFLMLRACHEARALELGLAHAGNLSDPALVAYTYAVKNAIVHGGEVGGLRVEDITEDTEGKGPARFRFRFSALTIDLTAGRKAPNPNLLRRAQAFESQFNGDMLAAAFAALLATAELIETDSPLVAHLTREGPLVFGTSA